MSTAFWRWSLVTGVFSGPVVLSCTVAVGNIILRAVLISDDTDKSSVSSAVKVMWPGGLLESMLAISCS